MALRTVQRRTVDEKKKKGELENKSIVYDNYAPVTERVQVYDKPDTSTSRQRLEQAYATANLRPETVKTATTNTPIMQAQSDRADRQIYHSKYGNAKLGLGQGFAQGITAGFAGSDSNKYFRALNETQRNDLLNSGGYKAGNMVGRMAGASLAMKGGEGLLQGTGALNRLTSTGLGQKVTNALGSNAVLRNAFAKGIGRAGEEVTEAAITNAARDLTGRAITNAVTDIPYGVVQSVNENNAQGLTVRDPEYWKNLGVNLAMDIGVDSALDFGPTLVRGLRTNSALRQATRDIDARSLNTLANISNKLAPDDINLSAYEQGQIRNILRSGADPENARVDAMSVIDNKIKELRSAANLTDDEANTIALNLYEQMGAIENGEDISNATRFTTNQVGRAASESGAAPTLRPAESALNAQMLLPDPGSAEARAAGSALPTQADAFNSRGIRFTPAEEAEIREAIQNGELPNVVSFAGDKVDDLLEAGVISEDEAQAVLQKLTNDISNIAETPQSIETAADLGYNNIERGEINGAQGEQITNVGRGAGESDLRTASGEAPAPRGSEVNPNSVGRRSVISEHERVTGNGSHVVLSDQQRSVLDNAGITNANMGGADRATFSRALDEGRKAHKYGAYVDPKTVQDLEDARAKSFLSDDGMIGIAVEGDGNIVGAFKNPNSKYGDAVKDMLLTARANGGTKMDCFGENLVRMYERAGYEPVARVEFDPSTPNLAPILREKKPTVYALMKNTDDLDTCIRKTARGEYHQSSRAELDALPTMEYDDALKYRDGLLAKQEAALGNTDGPGGGGTGGATGTADFGDAVDTVAHFGTVGQQESQTFARSKGSEIFDSETKKQIKMEDFVVDKTNNQKAINEARALVDGKDTDTALADFKRSIQNGKFTSDAELEGLALIERLQKEGRYADAADVLADTSILSSESGRALQARKLYYASTPQGKLMAAQKMVNRLQKAHPDVKIEVPNELYDNLMKAAESGVFKDIDQANKELARVVWDQIPASFTEKMNAWRYLSMLGNPRTHVRNVMSNVIYYPLRKADETLSALMQKGLSKDKRTLSVFVGRTGADGKLRDIAKKIYNDEDQFIMNGVSKFSDKLRPEDSKIFRFNLLNILSKKNQDLLNAGDAIFSEPAYIRSLAGFLKARGYTAETVTDEVLQEARKFAVNHSLEATFRNANALADLIAGAKRYANVSVKNIPADTSMGRGVKKVAGMAVDAVFPFVKTPANILEQSYKHSPLGLIRGIRQLASAGGDTALLNKGIENIAKGLTGSSLAGLGAFMAYSGLATGKIDTSTAEGKYRQMKGEQQYSIGNGKYNLTMDWASPEAVPFFMGVNLATKAMEDDRITFENVLDALSYMTEPVFQMSMLQGLENAFDTSYGESGALTAASNIAQSYASQFIPTLAGQVARTMADERKTTTSTNEGATSRKIDRYFRGVANKIPGLNQLTEPYVDELGQTDNGAVIDGVEPWAQRAVQNMLLPGYVSKVETTTVTRGLDKLIDKASSEDQGDLLPPSTASYEVKLDEKPYRMSESDLTRYKETRGTYARNALNQLFQTTEYKNMSTDEQVEAVKDVYSAAKRKADDEFLRSQGFSQPEIDFLRLAKETRAKYKTGTKEEFVAAYNATKGNTNSYKKASIIAGLNGISYDTLNQFFDSEQGKKQVKEETYYMGVYASQVGVTPDMYTQVADAAERDGKSGWGKAELINYLDSQDIPQEQKMVLYDLFKGWNWKGGNPFWTN